MTKQDDSTLREYAHAMACAATAEQRLKGGGGTPRAYVGDTDVFDRLAHHYRANVRQQQRIDTLRVLEFDAAGITWVHGVAR